MPTVPASNRCHGYPTPGKSVHQSATDRDGSTPPDRLCLVRAGRGGSIMPTDVQVSKVAWIPTPDVENRPSGRSEKEAPSVKVGAFGTCDL